MKLNLKQLKESPGQISHLEGIEQWNQLDYKGRPLAFTRPVELKGQAFYRNGIVQLSIRLATEIEVECSRCLKAFAEPIRLVEALEFEEEPQAGFRGAPLDGFSFTYGLEELELRPYLEKLIAVSLNSKPLCRPDCRGLCPTCGRDLNYGPCSCRQERSVDPRLEKLKQFLEQER